MAKYKNREVTIIQELPHPQGDLVQIEHKEPGTMGTEIVSRSQVYLNKDEMKLIEDKRKEASKITDFKLEGDEIPATLPTVEDIRIQRMAEDNLKRSEDQAKENEEWTKKHPKAPSTSKQQLDAIKVVPYRDEKNETSNFRAKK